MSPQSGVLGTPSSRRVLRTIAIACGVIAAVVAGYILYRFYSLPAASAPVHLSPPVGLVELSTANGFEAYQLSLTRATGATLTPATTTNASGLIGQGNGVGAFTEVATSGPMIEIRQGPNTVRSAGVGKPLAVLANGDFLAATPSGIISVDPHTLATTSVIAIGSLITAVEGTRLATANRITNTVDLYALGTTSVSASYQYSIFIASTTAVSSVGFDGPDYLIVDFVPSGARLYYVPVDGRVGRLDPITFSP